MTKNHTMKSDWCKMEFSGIDLGDVRLNKRLVSLAEGFNENMNKSIYSATDDYNACKAAYRFFNNPRFTANDIMQAHYKRTAERIQGEEVVLAIHDSVTLDFNGHKKMKGLGGIGGQKGNAKGLLSHNVLITTLKGSCLGLVFQKTMKRNVSLKSAMYRKTSIEEKESFRWIEGLRQVCEQAPKSTTVVNVLDREADFYEFINEANKLHAFYVVRSRWDRKLATKGESIVGKLQKSAIAGSITVSIESNGRRRARVAKCDVKFAEILLKPSIGRELLDNTPANVVWVKETNPPEGEKAVEWMLLTNLTVDDLEQALMVIDFYRARWRIEEWHKILKSGCKVEDIALETKERFDKYFAIISVLSARLLWITYMAREAPEASCEVALTKDEWHTLHILKTHSKVRKNKKPFTLREAVKLMALLGGYVDSKSNGPPGITVIWRGWHILQESMTFREAFSDANMLKT